MRADASGTQQRRRIVIEGTVQGVGFRPAVYRLASSIGLAGFVRNDRGAVFVELEGSASSIERFLTALPTSAPPMARIASIHSRAIAPTGSRRFEIEPSSRPSRGDAGSGRPAIPADLAPCAECLRELAQPGDRRYRYPFINCVDCGPRFTITRDLPYDRAQTAMAAFDMCADCRSEYEQPIDRRFHAQPIACPACGPRLRFRCGDAQGLDGESALVAAVTAIARGRILAVKGAGGYLLACDATNDTAVRELRQRKRRPDKPFAVMGADIAVLERAAYLDECARRELTSPARPIVLAPHRPGTVAASVAPRLSDLGVFLPPTPLQHLLVAQGPSLQVMTSGNVAGEPIAIDDRDAVDRLSGIADAFLFHDRDICRRADDSVVRVAVGSVIPVRRARGYVPDPVTMPVSGPSVLAVGAQHAVTVCVTRGDEAFVSSHIGDLAHADGYAAFRAAIAHMTKLAGVAPAAIVHDLHPDYRSTRWAQEAATPRIAVQHHHAHVAACLVDNGRAGPAIGVAFDGTGLGLDGSLWGGEFVSADLGGCSRLGHLGPIALAGGEAAIREPWRVAVAALQSAGESPELVWESTDDPGDRPRLEQLRRVLALQAASPLSTGAGRWFDAVAVLCGSGLRASYDGQPAAELEAMAAPGPHAPYGRRLCDLGGRFVLDLRPAIRDIARDLRGRVARAEIAARFHATMAHAVLDGCVAARDLCGLDVVALTGGCFVNRLLLDQARALLATAGFEVLAHRRVPAGDGGLALGQAAVAAFQLASAGGGR